MRHLLPPAAMALLLAVSTSRADGLIDLVSASPEPAGARDAAMAGAAGVLGDDWAAGLRNPAGLAWQLRTEASLGLARLGARSEAGYLDEPRFTESRRRSGFDHAGLVVPVPVFRGGLSWAFGVHERLRFDQGLAWPDGDWTVADELRGGLRDWSISIAGQLSHQFAGGLSLQLHTGDAEVLHRELAPDGRAWFVHDRLDLEGWSLRLGGLWRPAPRLAIGLALSPPWQMDSDWTRRSWTEPLPGRREDQELSGGVYALRVPTRLELGAAFRERFWLLAASFSWQDWSEAELDDLPAVAEWVANTEIREAYGAVGTLRLGGELWVPRTDLRLRAGIWRRDIAQRNATLRSVQEIDGIFHDYDYWEVREDSPRLGLAAGLGWVFDEALSLDLSISQERWEQSWLELRWAGENEEWRVHETQRRVNLRLSLVYRY
jgi:long-subunit fatty acid transport protein